MAKILNENGVIKIIDDAGKVVVIEPSPFSPPTEMTIEEIDALMDNDWVRYSDTWSVSISKVNGIVTITGLIKGGAVTSSNVLLLPEEYRPKLNILTVQRTRLGTQRVNFYPSGYINVSAEGDRTASSDWVAINTSYKAITP